MRLDGFVPWPEDAAERYRREGYWRGETLGGLLRTWAADYGDRTAVSADGVTMTYAELDAAADRLAFGLRRLGIARGDRIVVHLPNVVEFVPISFALWRLGALPIYALPGHREAEIAYFAAHSEAVAYLACESFGGFDHKSLADAAREAAPSLRHGLFLGDGGDANLRELMSARVDPDEARAAADADPPAPSDVALFLLSGGTTGLPKLIARTHDDYAYNFRAGAELCGLSPETVYLAVLPAAHNFPLGCPGMLGTFSVGGRVVLSSSPKAEDAFAVIEAEGVTITALVPTLVIRWLESLERQRFDAGSLRVLQVGGARLNPEVARRVGPELGCTLQQVFGMGEGLLNYTRLDDPEEVVVGTQGRPMSPADEVLVVDTDGRPVPEGQPGELLTRGPYTIRGYYRAEEHNARAFTPDGFYRTGDVVRADPAGNLIVEGRMKDLINRGGEKISAEEIENLLLGHPSVSNAAAVAMPDPVLGEKVCAYVALRPDAAPLTVESLREYLAGRGIARYKWPERVETVDALPVTKVGKVDKKALRDDIAGKLQIEGSGAAR
ncbi:MAG TPA: (2,3-dihydroxybenzoyl)adenylate synthase [Acidimicrobiia bacterium]|nr:(2,3-dihydroxybenzoyl)adenylate synthase [Acidimicrobiia bacterium]